MKTYVMSMAMMMALSGIAAMGAQNTPDPLAESDEAVEHSSTAEQSADVLIQHEEAAKKAAARAQDIAIRAQEKAARVQERASRDMEKRLEEAQQKIEEAQSKLEFGPLPEDGWQLGPLNLDVPTPWRNAGQPLIVSTGDLKPEAVANLQEDLAVMARILTKTVDRETGRQGRDKALGIVISALPGSRRPQGIYLEGYGALFVLNADIPLVQPPSKEEETPEEDTNSTWEETRRELYGQKRPMRLHMGMGEGKVTFSSERVDELKQALLEALKNGSKLREVKPDESITVVVAGTQAGDRQLRVHVMQAKPRKGEGAQKAEIINRTIDANQRSGNGSTLTIRVKKSDVDAFAKGDLKAEEFAKRASISAY